MSVSDGALPMHVAFIAEGAYLTHAAAMLDSLAAHHTASALQFHLLYGAELHLPDSDRLERWLERRSLRLLRHRVPDALMQGFPGTHFHRSIWFRTLLPELLPHLDRVLYLDADTLVLAPLAPLYGTDLSRHLFAAVTNPLYPFMENWPVTRLGLPDGSRYINSGVLLLNLDAMRRAGTTEQLRRYAVAHPENRYPEQDALSSLFHEQCLFLHPRWNVQTTLYDLAPGELPFPEPVVRETRSNPAIAHFIGPFKPDHYLSRHPAGGAYLRHRANTPWPVIRDQGVGPVNRVLRRLPMRWQYQYFVTRATLQDRLSHFW
ncbi:MAG TPA: glycosyltransferase family 8 protein [Verrucomicrobiae bacterium]|nr:glycosyltransferase family 8 protein [Verrucomicrobiae bacterium]